MPSPVGHALGGLIAGRLVQRSGGRHWWALAALGMAPDLDLLFSTHSTYSHSLGAVLLVAFLGGLWVSWQRRPARDLPGPGRGHRPAGSAGGSAALVAAATYGSHLLLDWLGTDTSPPYGIMLWWPFSSGFSKAAVSWFPPVSRDVSSRDFWVGNPMAVAWELLTLGSILWLVTRARKQHP